MMALIAETGMVPVLTNKKTMTTKNVCEYCRCNIEKQSNKEDRTEIEVQHSHDGKTYTDKVVAYNDGFYEIVKGPRKGNLVHRWNVTNTYA